mgnify:CR=1 FL=1
MNESQIASVNGAPLHLNGESLDEAELRRRAGTELLRQQALNEGLLDGADAPAADGAISVAASTAIEALIEKNVLIPEPADEACRRYYAAHKQEYRIGERVRARHILFAVTSGVDLAALRKRAEAVLVDVRSHDRKDAGDRFADAARQYSNCPSGAEGGELGWLTQEDCAPEFARELLGKIEIGVLPRLVHSRFGLHVVEVLERDVGNVESYEVVREAVAQKLRQQAYLTALRQYVSLLAGMARIEGVDLAAAATPLVQ